MKKLILTSIAVLVLSTNLVEAASFDCTKASTEFEKVFVMTNNCLI